MPEQLSLDTPKPPTYHSSMKNIMMLALALVVVATTSGVLYWFFRRLRRIEEELWGAKRQEAFETALSVEDNEIEDEDTTEQ